MTYVKYFNAKRVRRRYSAGIRPLRCGEKRYGGVIRSPKRKTPLLHEASQGRLAAHGVRPAVKSVLFDELRFEFHRPKTIDFAVNVVIAFDKADILHFGTDFQHRRAAFNL